MANKWSDVVKDPKYQGASDSQKQAIADGFFNDVIKPNIPSGHDVEQIKTDFMASAIPAKPSVMERISAGLSDIVTPRTVVNPNKPSKPSTFKQDTESVDRLLPSVARDRVKDGQTRAVGQLVQQGYDSRGAAEKALEVDSARIDNINKQATKPVDLSYAGPMREKPQRSLGDYFKDTAGSLVKIPGAVVRDVANIGNMITADTMPTDVAGTMQRGMDEFDRRYGSDARQFENQEFSRIAKDPDQDFTSQVDYLLENPTFLADHGITTVGSMFLPAGASAGAMKILTKLTGGKVPPGIANALRSSTISGTVAMQNAAETFNDPDMKDVPLDVRYEAAGITALGTLLGNKIFGGGVERAIANKFNKSGAAQGFALAGKEGGQEAFESLSQSGGKAFALPGQVSLNQAVSGALMEGTMGAVMGGGAAVAMGGNGAVEQPTNTPVQPMTKGQKIIDFLKRQKGIESDNTATQEQAATPQTQQQSAQPPARPTEAINASDILEGENDSIPNPEQSAEVATKNGQKTGDTVAEGAGNELPSTELRPDDGSNAATSQPVLRSDIPDGTGREQAGVGEPSSPVSSWIIRNKETGETIMETAQKSVVDKINTDKYEAVPAQQHLSELSDPNTKAGAFARREQLNSSEPDSKPIEDRFANAGKLIDSKANEAATSQANDLPEPTEAQKEAGNYKVGRIKVGGLNISVENPDQSTRKGKDPDGTPWESVTNGHYGYIKGVVARSPDKEHVDVNVKPGTAEDYAGDVFIVNQNDPRTGKFDEPKIYMGYSDEAEAEAAYRSNYTPDWQGFGDMVRMPMAKFKEMLGDEKAFLKPIKAPKQPKPRVSKRANTLLNAIDVLGGIDNKYKWDISGEQKFARGGYNKIFRNASTKTLEQHIENGDLDDFLPYEMRSTATDDATAGRNYLADRIRNGDRVLPYDVELEAKQSKAYESDQLQADIESAITDDALDLDTVNALLSEAGYEEREQQNESRYVETESTDSGSTDKAENTESQSPAGSIAGDQGREARAIAAKNENTGTSGSKSQERPGVREIVTAIIKRRSAANQIGKDKAFDEYLAAAKEFLNGKDIKPARFKLASATFKNDQPLSDAYAQLAELAKAPAKEARANNSSNIDQFIQRIDQATTADQLRDIARDVQKSGLTDAQIEKLDYLAMGKLDALDSQSVSGDLLGDDTSKKQAVADAERAKDAKRNTGESDSSDFVLTGSNSEADKAAARGAQDLFSQAEQAKPTPEAAEEVIQTETKQKTVETATESKPNQEKIEDFGEKIGGARKDLWSGFKDKMQQSMGEDVASVPLAKSWPEPDYQGMIDAGADSMMVAHLRALRDAVPTKPKAGWKLKGWAQKVKALRDIAYSITQDGASFDKLRSELADFAKYASGGEVSSISDLADIYWRVGHEKSLKGIRVSVGTYSVYAGVEYKPAKTIWSVEKDSAATSYSNWPNQLATGATKEEAISNFAKAYKTLEIATPAAKQISFDIYSYRTKPGKFIIGKKVGKSHIDLKEFDSLKEAREYRANNQDELVKLLAKAKEIPNERNAENNPRVGADHRKGADVTPQAFAETFGFRGVEFGNYVENDKRQQDLNEAYDALMDMAGVLNIPAKAISLNGELGIAFGARGSGGKRPAKAHYEPGHIVINLTKNKGAGSLGHEWWHALDNYFSRMRGKSSDFTTEANDVSMAASDLDIPFTGNVRKEMIQAFGDVVKAIKSSSLSERSKQLDKTRTKDYWSTMLEMTARSFESYLISKLQDQNASNDYLANIVSEQAWGMESSYPYPTAGELPSIREAYVNFFDIVQTKEDDSGNVAMFKRGPMTEGGLTFDRAQEITSELQAKYPNLPTVKLVQTREDIPLPESVKDEINNAIKNKRGLLEKAQKAETQPEKYKYLMKSLSVKVNDVEGMYQNGQVWINVGAIQDENRLREVFAHETIGHLSIEAMLNEVDKGLFPKLLKNVQNLNKMGNKYIQEVWNDVARKQPGLSASNHAKEVLAFIVERGDQNKEFTPMVRTLWQRIVDGIKAFAKLVFNVDLNDSDVRDIMSMAERYAKGDVNKSDLTSVMAGGNAYFSLADGDQENSDIEFAREVLSELGAEDGFFRHPLSKSASLQTIMSEVYPDSKYVGDATREDERTESGADKRTLFRNEHGKDFYVYEKGREVWIDVSRFDEGEQGGSVYAAVGNYAHNAKKVFVGDPAGLSEAAVVRRTKHMLGLALRFGTTDFIEPSSEQLKGDKEKGIAPIKWGNNDIENTRNLIDTFISTTENKYPQLAGYSYDFGRREFIDADGRPVSGERFSEGAKGQVARRARTGAATLRAFILAKSLVQSASRPESRGILQRVLNGSRALTKSGQPLSGLFSRSGGNEPPSFSRTSQIPLNPDWDSLNESGMLTDLQYKFQDKHADLKDVIKAIKATGREISDRFNPYLQEELYHGRVAKRVQDFTKKELEPLLQAMNESGVSMADFEHFLWARHAEERNAQIAKINPDMPDGGSGLTNKEAADFLAQIPAKQMATFKKLAEQVDAINAKSRNLLVEYGLEDMDTAAKMEEAYKHYVPLMRDEMEKGHGSGTGQGFSIKGNSTKRAMGSNKAVVDIIANIAAQREKFIVRGEKNRVATALVGLAKMNPNDDFWKVDKPPVIRYISSVTGLVEEMTDPNYKSRNNVVVARILDRSGRVQERAVVFNEYDERALRMAESLKNLDVDGMEEWIGTLAKGTRYFASVNTQYNPLFGVVNITRDIQAGALNLESTKLAGMQKEVIGQTYNAWIGIYKDLRNTRKGKKTAGHWSELWEEYQNEGGQTGYRELFRTAKDRTDELNKIVDPDWWKKKGWGKVVSLNSEVIANAEALAADKVGKPIFQWLDDYNASLENSVRLAAYKAGLDKGLSKQEAASIAKNLTVNFNRKGAAGARMGAFYAFFNASVQGTARIGETMFKDGKLSGVGKKILTGGILLGVIQALAMAGFDDEEPPQFERDRNLIIPVGGNKYVKIPMPLGFHVIPATARILTEYALNGGDDTAKMIAHLGEVFADAFNPVGGSQSLAQILSFTVTDPILDLTINEDFAGRQIAQKDFNSLDPTPGFTRARDTASSVSTVLAHVLNNMTGGTDYQPGVFSPTPDQIDYLTGQIFGGVGREILKFDTTARSIANGTDLPTYKIPLVGKFYGDAASKSSEGRKFYANIERMNGHENEIKGRNADGKPVQPYLDANPDARLWRQSKFIYSTVKKMQKRRDALLKSGAPADEIQEIDTRITQRMKALNDMVDSAKK